MKRVNPSLACSYRKILSVPKDSYNGFRDGGMTQGKFHNLNGIGIFEVLTRVYTESDKY